MGVQAWGKNLVHFQNDTPIKIYFKEKIIKGQIVNSDDFTMTVCIYEYMGEIHEDN